MPTTGPRIQVALDPLTYDVVRRLAKAGRLSMSRICADVIEQAAPIMARSTKMLEDAARLSEEAKDQLRRELAKEEKLARRAYGQAFEALAATEAAVRKAAEAGHAPARERAMVTSRSSAKTGIRRRPGTPGQ